MAQPETDQLGYAGLAVKSAVSQGRVTGGPARSFVLGPRETVPLLPEFPLKPKLDMEGLGLDARATLLPHCL